MVGEGCRKVMAGTGAGRYLTGNRKQVATRAQVTVTDACSPVSGTEVEERAEEGNATANDGVREDMEKLPETLTEHSVIQWEESMKSLRAIDTPPGEDPSSDETKGSGAGHFVVDDGRSGEGTMQRRAHGLHASAELPNYSLGPRDDLVRHLYIFSVCSNASPRHQV